MTELKNEPSHVPHVRPPRYDFRAIEAKWRKRWEEEKLYEVDLYTAQNPFYNLMMFPYPSAEGLHVGNMYAFVGSDIHGRWRAMNGYDVFEPMGFDAFGIHSENFALKRNIHPFILTARNVARFREEQLKRIGNRFDWSHEVQSTDPRYYRWTQWIFVQLFKHGLAERKAAPVNWCPHDLTVLADEQVIHGHCERCGSVVERRWLSQWFLKITNYAQQLLKNLDVLDWDERVKTAQRNWIGRSEGLEFSMSIENWPAERVQVYTTRPDTIMGMTFVALTPRHPLISVITGETHHEAVLAYQETVNQQFAKNPGDEAPMTGVFTGAYALHPLSGERVPIWVADYVLEGHGTDAIMGVPAHDGADLAFARAMGLPVRIVVQSVVGDVTSVEEGVAFTRPGVLVDSGPYSGLTSQEARAAIIGEFEARGIGKRAIKYRLRDWLISRQRYWGPPIPIIYCPTHGAVPVPEDQLPVLLPETENWRPMGTGSSPLAALESFVQVACPICGEPSRRETDVSDNFLDSAWYYLRYPSSDDDTRPWDPALVRRWLPVDMYIGGVEHSVLHLLYARFITMALHDMGYLDFTEPFTRFRGHGMITQGGAKISKSKGNVINPDEYIASFGADIFRVYLLFMGSYEIGGDFSDRGLAGSVRFLDRVWQLVTQRGSNAAKAAPEGVARREMHQTIKRVSEDIPVLKYNTAIAALMEYLRALEERPAQVPIAQEELRTLLLLLAPFAPFITEELWESLGHTNSIHRAAWPSFDEEALRQEFMTIVVQVNGRVRDRLEVSSDASEEEIRQLALASERVQRFLAGQAVSKVVYVPGRLVNVVVGP